MLKNVFDEIIKEMKTHRLIELVKWCWPDEPKNKVTIIAIHRELQRRKDEVIKKPNEFVLHSQSASESELIY